MEFNCWVCATLECHLHKSCNSQPHHLNCEGCPVAQLLHQVILGLWSQNLAVKNHSWYLFITQCRSILFLVLFLHFRRKTRFIKMGLRVCVCVQFWSPPNKFHTNYAIDTKFWLHIVSYRNSPTPLVPFLNFENCAREKFLKFIFFSI